MTEFSFLDKLSLTKTVYVCRFEVKQPLKMPSQVKNVTVFVQIFSNLSSQVYPNLYMDTNTDFCSYSCSK